MASSYRSLQMYKARRRADRRGAFLAALDLRTKLAADVAKVVVEWFGTAHGWTDHPRPGLLAHERLLLRGGESTLVIALDGNHPATWSDLERVAARGDRIHADRTALIAPAGVVSGEEPSEHARTLVALGPAELEALQFETQHEDLSGL